MSINLQVSNRPIDSVTPYARNARSHSKAQIDRIARSIEAFGFINPVLVDEDGVLVAGHARLQAAKQLGLSVIPTICINHLSESEKRAYIIADNRLAEDGTWDKDLLRVELEFLANIDLDFNIELTGFTTPEIDLNLHSEPVPEEEIIPPPNPANAVSRTADVWQLREHRVIVGDSRDAETVDVLMQGKLAKAAYCDAPYNVPIKGFVSGLGKHQHREFAYASGEMSGDLFTTFLTEAMLQAARVSENGALQYWFSDWRHAFEFLGAGKAVYDRLINLCVWAKTNAGMGSLYRSQHELIWIFKRGTAPHTNNVELGKHGRYRTNLWTYPGANVFGVDRDETLAAHPTPKNTAMLADAILDVTNPKDIVIDFFLGSGSTLIAAENTGRICFGIEIDPVYMDVIIARWERATGQQAVLAGTDRTFDEVAAERRVRQAVAS